jgi:hypothetical protein
MTTGRMTTGRMTTGRMTIGRMTTGRMTTGRMTIVGRITTAVSRAIVVRPYIRIISSTDQQ